MASVFQLANSNFRAVCSPGHRVAAALEPKYWIRIIFILISPCLPLVPPSPLPLHQRYREDAAPPGVPVPVPDSVCPGRAQEDPCFARIKLFAASASGVGFAPSDEPVLLLTIDMGADCFGVTLARVPGVVVDEGAALRGPSFSSPFPPCAVNTDPCLAAGTSGGQGIRGRWGKPASGGGRNARRAGSFI
ncbi:hypothetical protein CONPUDRAFT_155569 [Coniophora puteana RWD-64-598 SS2]|uniref:Uncharacterized protein n=1 Tax=Coniophora puteana (strain RWD-64-598) TaxID=741705 RepID=A0A5M3MIL7_CONPW|nr:uncharacterized protein CONPUDRAFT_155569 [Coniophora puteana RWD-64-598 SS2]EIW78856.1 hypothetical protein CONPUDRAFT_155569 [Coniophora puteana RWD-64-598 SS2]